MGTKLHYSSSIIAGHIFSLYWRHSSFSNSIEESELKKITWNFFSHIIGPKHDMNISWMICTVKYDCLIFFNTDSEK